MCNILLTETAIRTVFMHLSMIRFPSNCDVILHQRCGETNFNMFISTFSVITGPYYVTLLSISIPKTATIPGSRAETFGLYLRPNNVQTTRFCVPVDSLCMISYMLFCVRSFIHINVKVTVMKDAQCVQSAW